MKKALIIVLIVAILLGVLFYFLAPRFFKRNTGPSEFTLTVWGLWENVDMMKPVIEEYQKLHPNIKVEYSFQSRINYRNRLQTKILENQGPDIYLIHATWLPMFLNVGTLSPLPSDIMNDEEYGRTFYPVARESLSKDGRIYGMPLEIDGLALYYNEDLINKANVAIPTNWIEFRDVAARLTEKDEVGNIKVAGAAMGETGNVDHFSDIIGLLFKQQPGADLANPANSRGADVLKFYTSFTMDPQFKSWDKSMDVSTQAFFSGRLAFYFAPSWRAHEIRQANPQLKFKIAPVPQLPGRETQNQVTWATFWTFAVSSRSAHQREAWEFLKFLTSSESEQLLYQTASASRDFGQPYSRVDLGSKLSADPWVGAFVNQGPYYKSWYLASRTFDDPAGINDSIIRYYENAINETLKGADPQTALSGTAAGVKQILDQYNSPPQPVQR